MITVTKTFLPPQDEYNAILKRAWDKNWITNRGELVLELESKLKEYLGVKNVIAMTNGTLPIQIAIKALGLKGEIITTPFSYVATTSSIVWEGCTPVFVDIDPEYLTIDETKIEAAITSKTTGILATHVYGNPCNVEVIEQIAVKHNLKVIYDAAHCFGVQYKGQSIFNYGDISTCSFHATKVFHTGEGGAVFCNEERLNRKIYLQHNFGHDGPENFTGSGINAKMSELQGAMGLAVLPSMKFILEERKRVFENYTKGLEHSRVISLRIRENTNWNYSYYPIILDNEEVLLQLVTSLEKSNIFARRYFYPSLNTLSYVNYSNMPISEDISKRILCLPLYTSLLDDDVLKIIKIIKSVV
jgi:dTDP-4-amino-4,6-dideoxygalactose transaminase